MTMPVVLGASQLEGPRGGWAPLSTASLEQRRSIGPKQASLAALNPAPWAFAMEPGAAWGPGLKRYVFNLALNEFTKSASLMSSGSEFHKSQFILWGRVIDFFFIVCFSFFSPPSCQPSSTWIELFDLRVALLKEEEMPLPSFNTSPTYHAQRIPLSSRSSRGGTGSPGFPQWGGVSTGALTRPFPALSLHVLTLGQFGARL